MRRYLAMTVLAGTMVLPLANGVRGVEPFTMTFQDREAEQESRKPARLRHKDRAVTVIPGPLVSELPVLDIPVKPVPGKMKVKASVKARPAPASGAAGKLKAAPQGKLKFTLTPHTPSLMGRGYLNYNYPNNVRTHKDENYAEFSKGNIPGSLYYHTRLVEGRKYLIEVEVAPKGTSGGHVVHKIGDEESNHKLGTFNKKMILSRVVQPSATGWVYGRVAQANSQPPGFWQVYRVSVTELD